MYSYHFATAVLLFFFLTPTCFGQFDDTSPCKTLKSAVAAREDDEANRKVPESSSSNCATESTGRRSSPQRPRGPVSLKTAFFNLPGDQKAIWTSPFHLRTRDLPWLLPWAGSSAALFATDQRNVLREHSNSGAVSLSNNISNSGTVALATGPAVMYLWGSLTGAARQRETGLLTGEALINSVMVSETLKTVFGRERPTLVDGELHFFREFGNPSFPSNHSMWSWTAASVIAHEYPGFLSQTLAYGTAAAVSVSRVTARQHFPSDTVIGATLGWMIGREVYRAHHDSNLDDLQYGSFRSEAGHFRGPQIGTTYVPIENWVYGAFDRLAAMGYVRSGQIGLRPWTRAECARLTEEAAALIGPLSRKAAATILDALRAEFAPELELKAHAPTMYLEEAYSRIGYLSGEPLTDDYHFAKTITNDYGRPFGQGPNALTGLSARSVVGPLAFYIRAEYQHAGSLRPQPAPAQQAISTFEDLPFPPPQRTTSLNRVRLIDSYASFSFHKNVISFGNQTLWWGPGADAPFLESNNAEPIPMLRISRASPFVLPWWLSLMGPIRLEAFWGQLRGQQFVALFDATGNRRVVPAPLHPHPVLQGAKFSFKPTSNLEFGFGVTAILSGPGFPFTLHSLLRSYSPSNTIPGLPNDPGDRRSGFDFSYRLPGMRNWLTLYGDSFTEDEFSPITFPRKSSFRTGLYAPRLPCLGSTDLRVEGIYTDIPSIGMPGVEYFNGHYLSGYTNYGQIIGNAIGREGRGINAWTTYHFDGLNSIQLHYRSQHVNPEFLEGGYLRDFDAKGIFVSRAGIGVSATLKYERWNFPLLAPGAETNVSGSVILSYQPAHGLSLTSQK